MLKGSEYHVPFTDRKRTCRRPTVTQKNLDDNGDIFETSPSKSLVQLAQQTGVCTTLAQNGTQLLHLCPNKTAMVC